MAPPRSALASHGNCNLVVEMTGDDLKPSNQTCIDCNAKSPQTETNYTLISSRYGWRLSLESRRDGRRTTVWRCPTCWERHRRGKPAR